MIRAALFVVAAASVFFDANSGLAIALAAGALSLAGVVFTGVVNARTNDCARELAATQRELEAVKRERLFLKQRNELLIAFLIRTLPEPERFDLLAHLSEITAPTES